MTQNLTDATREELLRLRASLDAAIRREQRFRERLLGMVEDEDGPDDWGKGRREGWNTALFAAAAMLDEGAA